MPFNIIQRDAEYVLQKKPGIIDWKEDIQYLRNQLSESQPGTFLSFDQRQAMRDERKQDRAERLEAERKRS